jgi:drug/metabolite transporter (DMT)-like permease
MNPIVALIIANIIWGAASPIFKFALTNIPPFTLAFIRFFFAGLIFLPFILFKDYSITKKQLLTICLGAFFAITVNISFFFLGIQMTTSINAPVIGSSQPIFILLFAILFLKEKFHKRTLVGILTSLAGVLIVILSPLWMNHGTTLAQKDVALVGNLFLVLATFGAIMQAIIFKKVLKEVDSLVVTCLSFLFGAFTFIPFMVPELNTWSITQLNSAGWTGILFGVFLSSAAGYGLYLYGVSKLEAQEVGIFTYIDPVAAVILAVPLLHEYPTPSFFIGSFFVFLGILIAEKRLHWHPIHKIHRARIPHSIF